MALYQSTVLFDSGSTTRFENNIYGYRVWWGDLYIASVLPLLPQLLVALENGIQRRVDFPIYASSFV